VNDVSRLLDSRQLSSYISLYTLVQRRLAAGGRGGAVPPPDEVSLGPSGKRDPHVPQHARAPRDLPLAVGRDVADLGVFIPTVVRRAHLPPDVDRADLPLLGLGLLRHRDELREAPPVNSTGRDLRVKYVLCSSRGALLIGEKNMLRAEKRRKAWIWWKWGK
jgi:hypothetical protein